MFTYLTAKYIGIACACHPKPNHPYNYACLIAIADQAPVRDIKERVPAHQTLLDKEHGEQCFQKCPYLKNVPAPRENFVSTSDCSYVTDQGIQVFGLLDESGFCRRCSDFIPHCNKCDIEDGDFVCSECKQEFDDGLVLKYDPYYETVSEEQSCAIPGCTQTSDVDDLYC